MNAPVNYDLAHSIESRCGYHYGGFVNDEKSQAALRGWDSKDPAAEVSPGRIEELRRLHLDQLLDQALDASFPASDPPSVGRSS